MDICEMPSSSTGQLLTGYILTPDKEIVVSFCFGEKLGDCNEITKTMPARAAATIADFIAGKIEINQLRRSTIFGEEWKELSRTYRTLAEFYEINNDLAWLLSTIGLSCQTVVVPHGHLSIDDQAATINSHFHESFRISWKQYE